MAFPIIPVIIALGLYILQSDEAQSDEKVKAKPVTPRKNKIEKITQSDIDDKSKSVPDSPPPAPENSVPTEPPLENPTGDENVQ